jgi:hypothetical protein
MQREYIVTDAWKAKLHAARLKFAAVCKKQAAGPDFREPRSEDSPLERAVERLIAVQAAARTAGGHR